MPKAGKLSLKNKSIQIIETEVQALALIEELYKQTEVAIDTETTGLNYLKDRVVVWSVSFGKPIPCRIMIHGSLLPLFREWLESDVAIRIFQNSKYDVNILRNHGIFVGGTLYDTLVMDWLYDENRQGRHGLDSLAFDYLGILMKDYSEMFGKIPLQSIVSQEWDRILDLLKGKVTKKLQKEGVTWLPSRSFTELFGEFSGDQKQAKEKIKTLYARLADYSTLDSQVTLQVFWYLRDKLKTISRGKTSNLWDYYVAIEVPFTRVLLECERNGVHIDVDYFKEIEALIDQKLIQVEKKFYKLAGREIDLNSSKQLSHLFFDELKYPVIKSTKTKVCKQCNKDATKKTNFLCKEHGARFLKLKPATGDEVLTALTEQNFPLAKVLSEFRGLSKLQSTYVRGFLNVVTPKGTLHTVLKQVGTLTGRLSSGDARNGFPPLQNFPAHEKDPYRLREGFIAPPGCGLIVLDYSQIELRLLAHFSQDEVMMRVYLSDGDIHTETAIALFNKPADQITSSERRFAKTINFGIMYGETEYGLAPALKITQDEAKQYLKAFFRRYAGVKHWIDQIHVSVRKNQYVTTLLGRRRRLPEIMSHDPGRYGHAKRQAINCLPQGGTADIAKKSMLNTSELYNPKLKNWGVKLILQVHDEFMYECPLEHIEEATVYIKGVLEHPFDRDLSIPLKASGGWGLDWMSAKD